jgi:hypothetical protein
MDEVLDKVTHRWRGETEVYDSRGTRSWERREGVKPIMNDQGIDYVISQIHLCANKNTNLSNLTKEEAYRLARISGMSTATALFLNYEKYAIDSDHFVSLCVAITDLYLKASMRAVVQGERTFLTRTGIEQNIQQVLSEGKGVKLF